MNQDCLAALERLRRVKAGDSLTIVYDKLAYSQCSEMEMHDKCLIYDAEHDDTPATVEWCKQFGDFYSDGIGVRVRLDGGVTIWDLQPGVMLTIHGLDVLTNPTRGDVLRLLGVFSEREVQG